MLHRKQEYFTLLDVLEDFQKQNTDEEVQHRLKVPLQEKFHRGTLEGVRSVSDIF